VSTFILVHGSFHGGWCWEKVVPYLVQAGHKVVALDLPAHGEDTTPVAGVTLQSYVDTVLHVLDTRKEPVVLVGHSFGGVVISQVAEARPDALAKLVYLSSIVLLDGQAALNLIDPGSMVGANAIINQAEGWCFVKQEMIPQIYYNDCSPEDIAATLPRLTLEPLQPYLDPAHLTAANFGRVPKYYIGCQQDNAVTPAMQEAICAMVPMQQIFTLNTSHSPFLSQPGALADILLKLA
jgi:pimeloyl-ACP methyl ester carboxylesterase